MDPDDLARLKAAFSAPEPPRGGESPGVSAVLVPLFSRSSGLSILYTRRAASLSSHPGEVSFPGGRVDPGDSGPLAAALRETWEEVGIDPSRVDVVGHLTDFMTFRGTVVCAYVGHVAGPPPVTPASPAEVEDLLMVPVSLLLAEDRYEGRAYERFDRVVHYWRLASATMWGITGELTARFLERAYGWKPPRPPRLIESPEQFIP